MILGYERKPPDPRPLETQKESTFSEYFLAAAVVLGVTLPAFLLQPTLGYRALGLLYLLTVVAISLFVRRGPTLFAATISALLWDFFFLAPITNLRITNTEDLIMFGTYFVHSTLLSFRLPPNID